MASYWSLFPGINTVLLWYLSTRHKARICKCRCVITQIFFIQLHICPPPLFFFSASRTHFNPPKKTVSHMDPFGCFLQVCVILFRALTSSRTDTACAGAYQWKGFNNGWRKFFSSRNFHLQAFVWSEKNLGPKLFLLSSCCNQSRHRILTCHFRLLVINSLITPSPLTDSLPLCFTSICYITLQFD